MNEREKRHLADARRLGAIYARHEWPKVSPVDAIIAAGDYAHAKLASSTDALDRNLFVMTFVESWLAEVERLESRPAHGLRRGRRE